MKNKILLIEDNIAISEMVENYLRKEGFNITTAFDGEEGLVKFLNNSFDLIILDIMMPKLDGMEVMRIIREKSVIPILIMSAKDSDVDKAIGLGLGADDYIAKPFSMVELSARIKAMIRRATQYDKNDEKEDIINVNDITIDLNSYVVTKKGVIIQLTSKEFNILKLFISNPNRVFTKAQVYNFIWNDDYFGDDNVINVHMRRLREKIEDNPSEPKYIKTLWGIGYKLGEF
ncbi:response regulator transcription factor [Clostridium senegalense]|uniref:response regulator transcription factor n=1 Tax=Clostridium senegalense TaxID=1465809 RepID=UPI001C122298|nr:response regulator transcription factor [Clostridium senegalense]MBU5227955.1 response regulator transcription factor [Clostridium senegalense]